MLPAELLPIRPSAILNATETQRPGGAAARLAQPTSSAAASACLTSLWEVSDSYFENCCLSSVLFDRSEYFYYNCDKYYIYVPDL